MIRATEMASVPNLNFLAQGGNHLAHLAVLADSGGPLWNN